MRTVRAIRVFFTFIAVCVLACVALPLFGLLLGTGVAFAAVMGLIFALLSIPFPSFTIRRNDEPVGNEKTWRY